LDTSGEAVGVGSQGTGVRRRQGVALPETNAA
jgi:hypothetical protein